MSGRKVPRITNLWSKVEDEENGAWLSKVTIESTKAYAYEATSLENGIMIKGKGVVINMPEGIIGVHDGLLREVNIKHDDNDYATMEIIQEYPAEFRLAAVEGFPFRLEAAFDRSYLRGLLGGKKIVVDPGHGGSDKGGKGPVSLLEKNVVVPIAKNLEETLLRAGADVLLTRRTDQDLSREERYNLAVQAGADAYVGIHTHASADSSVGGAASLYNPFNQQSVTLARFIQEGLVQKIKVADRGITSLPELSALGEIPAVEVEVVAITNLVEEVFLRGLTIQERAAEGIFNGLIKYFALNGCTLKVS